MKRTIRHETRKHVAAQARAFAAAQPAPRGITLKTFQSFVAAALAYARIDEESPHRAAPYWIIQGWSHYDFADEAALARDFAVIEELRLTDAEAVAICRAFGAQI
jgi:hypothetical protein